MTHAMEQVSGVNISRRPKRRLPGWFAPFGWVIAAPPVVLPVTTLLILIAKGSILHEDLGGKEPLNSPEGDLVLIPVAEYDYVEKWPLLLIHIIPSLCYLVAVYWLLTGPARIRVSAAIASTLGLILMLLPVWVWEMETIYTWQGTDYYAFDSEGFFGGFWTMVVLTWILVAVAWVCAIVTTILCLIAMRIALGPDEPSR